MAQPRDYTRQYNFNDFQTTNPSDPLPGPQVDGELDAVKLTLDDLNANIGKIQRDDGKLKNASVHKDAFSQDALALVNSDFTPRGDWSTATAYAVNDAVDFNGATYVATVAHTSSAAFSTDDAADRWILIANAAISGTGSAVDKFEGDGNTTSFTLTYTYASETAVQVFVNGELLNPVDDYTISGNTLTLYTAPGLPTVAGNENVIVWGASVVAQAAAQDASGHESNASGYADEAESWASQTTGIVESTDYSSKAYAIGGTGVDTGAGSAKDWATKTSGTVGNTTEYSSKYWATQGNVPIVAQNIADINTVAGISSNVTAVANNETNVNTVAGIDGNVTTVAGISANVTTVANNDANVTTLAGLNTQITTLGAISTDISTVSGISANTTTVAGISSDVTTAAGISANITTVAGISSNVTTVATNNANVTTVATDLTGTNTIGTTAGSIANVNIVANAIANVNSTAQNIADVNTVAAEINNNNLQTVANDIQAVITTANDLNEATSEIDTVANSIANVDLVGGSISNVNTVAANLTDVNAFFDTYAIGATAPASPTTGDLWFDTSSSTMKVYSGSGFINAGSSVNGTAARFVYTATAAQTTFTGADDGNNTLAYDAGFVDIYMNGVKLAPADYTASNGTSIVLASGAALNDVIEIVAYGTFTLANLSLNDLTDVSTANNADHKILAYNVANQQFEPRSTATLTGLYLTGSATITDNSALYLGTGLDLAIFHDAGTGDSHIQETGTGNLKFDTNNTTRMLLDQSGNLLVGKTATTVSTDGFEVLSGGHLAFTRNNDTPVFLNRRTSDGSIIDFRKDNTTVGSIKSRNSESLMIGSDYGSDAYICLSNDNVFPVTSTGAVKDGATNLGVSTGRWRDLHLSGTAFLTGTSSISGNTSSASSLGITSGHSSSPVVFYTGEYGVTAVERMRIDSSSGNVGIGTSSTSTNYGAYKTPLIVERSSGYGYVEIRSGSTANQAGLILNRQGNTGWLHAMDNSGKLKIAPMASINEAGLTNAKDGSTGITVDTSGRVGIGTTLPGDKLTVSGADAYMLIDRSNGEAGATFRYNADNTKRADIAVQTNGDLRIKTNLQDRARVTSSGHLLVGKSSTVFSTQGAMITAQGSAEFTRDSVVLNLNRTSSDGDIMRGYKDGVNVFSVNRSGYSTAVKAPATSGVYNHLELGASAQNQQTYYLVWDAHNGRFYSAADNTHDVGSPFLRWDDVYATNGTINTSDQNEKQQIASLTDAEIIAAKAISKLFKTYKWNDSVAEKGDAARTHSGVIAQEVEQAMTDAGLNAGDYAFFISTTWWETHTEVPAVEAVEAVDATYDEDGNMLTAAVSAVEAQEAYTRTERYESSEEAPEGATERNRKGIRYPQLLSFIGAATEQRLASIETRLDALEAN